MSNIDGLAVKNKEQQVNNANYQEWTYNIEGKKSSHHKLNL